MPTPDAPSLDTPLPETPFAADLRATVEAMYRLSPTHVPKTLMVCRCPVCMSGETLAAIIATPVRNLAPALVQEYSNSAHGTPTDSDDLNALLPRYLDLIAQDIEVNWSSVGADLQRFGDARGMPGFPAPGMAEEMDRYARALLMHFAALEVQGDEPIETAWSLLPSLLIGGWSIDTLSAALEDLFARPDLGRPALVWFLSDMARNLHNGRLDLWAFSRYGKAAAPGLAAWLNLLLASDAVTEIFTDPALLPEEAAVWIPPLTGLRGQITAEMLGG